MEREVTSPPRRRVSARLVAAWAIFAAYFVAARGVGNFFPLSVFDMYQGRAPEAAARIVAVDERGRTSELSGWKDFDCEGGSPRLTERIKCGRPDQTVPYVARDLQGYVDANLGGGAGEPLSIVSRTYRLTEGSGPLEFSDCLIARCTARRRSGP